MTQRNQRKKIGWILLFLFSFQWAGSLFLEGWVWHFEQDGSVHLDEPHLHIFVETPDQESFGGMNLQTQEPLPHDGTDVPVILDLYHKESRKAFELQAPSLVYVPVATLILFPALTLKKRVGFFLSNHPSYIPNTIVIRV